MTEHHEYIIKKENKQVKIITSAYFAMNGKLIIRIARVEYLPKRARVWRLATEDAEYKYRIICARGEEKQEWCKKAFLAHCTEDDMREAIKEHYEAIKPDLNEIIIWA